MRPAQIAREISVQKARKARRDARFNEARANCAGNLVEEPIEFAKEAGFNEARANCAGNLENPPNGSPTLRTLQ